MEQFTRNNPKTLPDSESSRSSLYSTDSGLNRLSYVDTRASTDTTRTTSSRPISLAPSYMSAAIPRRKPAPIMTTPPPANTLRTVSAETPSARARSPKPPTSRASKGLLLIVVAANPSLNTISHVRVLLKRHAFSGVTIVGNNEYEARLKQLRMDLYSLIGGLSMELGVQTYLRGSWSETETAAVLEDAVGKVDERIRAVLCVPGTEEIVTGEILQYDESQLAMAWQQSFGFIHTVARTTFPLLLQDGNAKRVTSGFFVTQTIDQGAATMVMRSACGLLLRQLAETHRANGLAVGYAEENLIPEPEPEMPASNGHERAKSVAMPTADQPVIVTPAESPTKLWGMWALQEQLGDAV